LTPSGPAIYWSPTFETQWHHCRKKHIFYFQSLLEGDTPNTAGHGCMRHVELRWFIRVWNEQCFDRATVEHKMPVRMYQRTPFQTRCAQRAQTPPRPLRCRGEARWRPLTSDNISYQAVSRNVNGNGKVIVDAYPDSAQHQKLTTSRGSSLVHADHVW